MTYDCAKGRKNRQTGQPAAGFLAAMAGILTASRVYSGQPTTGVGFEGEAIASAVLGGVSFTGGVGTLSGSLIGILIMGVMSNGMNLLQINYYWREQAVQYINTMLGELEWEYFDCFFPQDTVFIGREFHIKTAVANFGPMDFEILQPYDGEGSYLQEALKENGPGLPV